MAESLPQTLVHGVHLSRGAWLNVLWRTDCRVKGTVSWVSLAFLTSIGDSWPKGGQLRVFLTFFFRLSQLSTLVSQAPYLLTFSTAVSPTKLHNHGWHILLLHGDVAYGLLPAKSCRRLKQPHSGLKLVFSPWQSNEYVNRCQRHLEIDLWTAKTIALFPPLITTTGLGKQKCRPSYRVTALSKPSLLL